MTLPPTLRGSRLIIFFGAIHKAGEAFHPEYERTGVKDQLQRQETILQQRLQQHFDHILTTIESRLGKAETPLPGFIMAFVDDNHWWTKWNAELADIISSGVLPAAETGVQTAGRQLSMSLNWELLLPSTRQWAELHAGELVRAVEENIKVAIREAVTEGLLDGLPWRQVSERIALETGLPSWRAARIARTEIIRAHAQGAISGYKSSGTVSAVKWLDAQPGACDKCKPLHNIEKPLGEPFYVDKFGDGFPPRHPNCRCAIAPVTMAVQRG